MSEISAEDIQQQREWAVKTFGDGKRLQGNLKHIRKELREIEENPEDIVEWVDVVILAFDGAMRYGFTPEQIIETYKSKMAINYARSWPDWRLSDENVPIEHVRD
jgi:hypothetical protein